MNNQQLIEQLTKQAGDSAFPFSHDLHRRIMARFDAESSVVGPVAPSRSTSRLFWRTAAVMSSAAAIALAVGLVRFTRPVVKPVPAQSVAMRIPAAPVISNPVRSLEGPAVRKWAGSQVADFDQDADNVVAYVQRQFDVIPSPR